MADKCWRSSYQTSCMEKNLVKGAWWLLLHSCSGVLPQASESPGQALSLLRLLHTESLLTPQDLQLSAFVLQHHG